MMIISNTYATLLNIVLILNTNYYISLETAHLFLRWSQCEVSDCACMMKPHENCTKVDTV